MQLFHVNLSLELAHDAYVAFRDASLQRGKYGFLPVAVDDMPNFFTMVGLFGAICSVFYLDWLIYRDFYVNLYFDSVLHS
jgi:hypothetical protein